MLLYRGYPMKRRSNPQQRQRGKSPYHKSGKVETKYPSTPLHNAQRHGIYATDESIAAWQRRLRISPVSPRCA